MMYDEVIAVTQAKCRSRLSRRLEAMKRLPAVCRSEFTNLSNAELVFAHSDSLEIVLLTDVIAAGAALCLPERRAARGPPAAGAE